MNKINVLDLFAGIGGLSYSFHNNSAFSVVAANELDKQIATSYMNNYPNVQMFNCDVNVLIEESSEFLKDTTIDIILGGPPCQGFSLAGKRNRSSIKFIDDPRNYLFRNYVDVVIKFKPKIFIMENVPGIMTMKNGEILEEIINAFSDLGYTLFYKIFNFAEYGVPQERNRFILFAIQNNIIENDTLIETFFNKVKLDLISKGKIYDVNIKDAISDLPPINIHNQSYMIKYDQADLTLFQKEMRRNSLGIFNHVASKHSKLAIERMKKARPWKSANEIDENIKSVHSGAYKRMDWNEKSKTIITRFDTPSSGKYTHPVENRTISPREAARLQSFPDNLIFYGSKTSICKQIGNAVPPKFSYFLSCVVKEILIGVKK